MSFGTSHTILLQVSREAPGACAIPIGSRNERYRDGGGREKRQKVGTKQTSRRGRYSEDLFFCYRLFGNRRRQEE